MTGIESFPSKETGIKNDTSDPSFPVPSIPPRLPAIIVPRPEGHGPPASFGRTLGTATPVEPTPTPPIEDIPVY